MSKLQNAIIGGVRAVLGQVPAAWLPGGTPDPLIDKRVALGGQQSRVDGPDKVRGAARFAAEVPMEGLLYAAFVHSTIARGRIAELDTAAAEAAPGVQLVMTYRNAPVGKRQATGDGDQREGVARAVADLAVFRTGDCIRRRRQFDTGDQLARLQHGLHLRGGVRQDMKVRERHRSLAIGPAEMDHGIEHGERDAHVGRMRGDALIRRAQDGMMAIEPFACVAARARLPLVAARSIDIVEIQAAGPLEDVAADRRHVADLRGGTGEQRTREHRVAAAYERMGGKGGVPDRGIDQQSAALAFPDGAAQVADVHQFARLVDILAQQIDEVGPAAQEPCPAPGTRDGIGPIGRANIAEWHHHTASASMSSIASTIPLCAPQRQRLPLMRSRISARVTDGGPAATSRVT